ncbi:hypothetical protein POHY109586_24325 [Polaromonas hydrogenivorans]
MDMLGKVRRMKLRDKFSTSAIAKLTGLSRNTVKKWLKASSSMTLPLQGLFTQSRETVFLATEKHEVT